MNWDQLFNVRAGVQYDMHLHGSRFIVVEFAFAPILEAGLLVLSINYGHHLLGWPWWYCPWLILCAGLIPNSITIWLLARQIARKEGARPPRPDGPFIERTLWMFSLVTILPLVLPLLAWRQRNQEGS